MVPDDNIGRNRVNIMILLLCVYVSSKSQSFCLVLDEKMGNCSYSDFIRINSFGDIFDYEFDERYVDVEVINSEENIAIIDFCRFNRYSLSVFGPSPFILITYQSGCVSYPIVFSCKNCNLKHQDDIGFVFNEIILNNCSLSVMDTNNTFIASKLIATADFFDSAYTYNTISLQLYVNESKNLPKGNFVIDLENVISSREALSIIEGFYSPVNIFMFVNYIEIIFYEIGFNIRINFHDRSLFNIYHFILIFIE